MQKAFSQTQELKYCWKAIYSSAASNPLSWQQQLPNALKALIEDSLDSLEFWLDQLCTKSAPFPVEQMAESVASEFLPKLLAALRELEAGNYGQLNHFINELTHLMTIIHTMPLASACNHEMRMSA